MDFKAALVIRVTHGKITPSPPSSSQTSDVSPRFPVHRDLVNPVGTIRCSPRFHLRLALTSPSSVPFPASLLRIFNRSQLRRKYRKMKNNERCGPTRELHGGGGNEKVELGHANVDARARRQSAPLAELPWRPLATTGKLRSLISRVRATREKKLASPDARSFVSATSFFPHFLVNFSWKPL